LAVDTKGAVAIGTNPTSAKLAVGGVIETTAGGVKFPDGSIQTSATVVSEPALQPFRYSSSSNGLVTTVPAGKRLVIENANCVTRAPGNNNWADLQITVGGVYYELGMSLINFDGTNTFGFHQHNVRIYVSPGEQVNVTCHVSAAFRHISLSGYYVDLPATAAKPEQSSIERGPARR
jgi:hypothetical protein